MSSVLPASLPRAVQRLAAAMPLLETTLEPASARELLEALSAEWLDAAVVSLPVPTAGLRVTPLGEQRIVAALSAGHEHAMKPEIRLEQLAPERLVVLPREANRSLYDGILAGCRAAGIAPRLVEMPDAALEHALLAVASGAGPALLPESVAERYGAPGVRFVPLAGDAVAFATALLTRRDAEHMPTVAFLRTGISAGPAASTSLGRRTAERRCSRRGRRMTRLKRLRRSARQRALMDGAIVAYTQWREECAAVRNAYRRWIAARAADRPFAFEDYNAALDREDRAARRYAHVMGRAGHLQETGLAHQLVQMQMSSRGG